jgi:hypothetical protein
MRFFLVLLTLFNLTANAAYQVPPLSITTAKLSDQVFSGLTAVTAALDDYVAIADTSDSNKKKKALVSDIKNNKYRSVTTTDAPSNTVDETLKLSGASFTVTLPTAVGVTGKRFTLVHAGTSFSQVYTLATTSAQTIGGIASGSYKIVSAGEVLRLESDGANWMIIDHKTNTGWVSYTPTFVSFGTVTAINFYYMRVGDSIFIKGKWTNGSNTGVNSTISFPSSTTINSTVHTYDHIGTGAQTGTVSSFGVNVDTGSSTSVLYFSQNAGNYQTKMTGTAFDSSATNSLQAGPIGMVDWQP